MLDKETNESRSMMCLYADGTNSGLRRVASATSEATYDELLHNRRRFITPEAIRLRGALDEVAQLIAPSSSDEMESFAAGEGMRREPIEG